MNVQKEEKQRISFFTLLRRWIVRILFSKGQCSGSCTSCKTCPLLSKDFEFTIKRKMPLEDHQSSISSSNGTT